MYIIWPPTRHSVTLEVEGEALQFLDVIRPVLLEPNRDPNIVYNMDQTPVWMAMDDKMTIDHVGTRTVNIRTATGDSKRVTMAVTVTASGRQVKHMVVFKGKKKNCLLQFIVHRLK